jgi:hypothetical protein
MRRDRAPVSWRSGIAPGIAAVNARSRAASVFVRGGEWVTRSFGAAVLLLVAVHLVLSYGPWIFIKVGPDLESSWQQVVTYATANGWQWGRDIAWTNGPLGFAWSAVYFEPLLAQVLVVKSLFVAALVSGVVGVLGRVPTVWSLLLYVIIAFAGSLLASGMYMMIPLLAALTYFRDSDHASARAVALQVIAAGILALTYSSSGVLSLALFSFMDLSRMTRRRAPIFVPLFAGAAITGFILAGQSLSTLPDYARSSFEIISGYAEAMSLKGHVWELLLYLALGLVAIASVVRCEFPSLANPTRRVNSALLLGCLLVFWFITFKTGFVRHDLHTVWSWSALAIGLAAYVAIRPAARSSPMLVGAMLGVAAVSCTIEVMLVYHGDRVSFLGKHAEAVFLRVPVASMMEARALLLNNAGWRKAMQQRREAARNEVGRTYAELRMPGTVDMIGVAQGALLLQDVDFRTRPVFQDFAAYTPWLIERNRAQLRGARAAQTILLSMDTVDNRYPMMDRGSAVLELLAHYRPERIAAGYLVLRRRDAPLDLALTATREQDATIGQWVEVAASDSPIMLNADIRTNMLGLLAKVLFRLPQVDLTVRLADGTERKHRIVPAYGRDGVLLSPYVDGVVGYAAMATGVPEAMSGNRVVAFKVDVAGERGRLLFNDGMHVRLSSIGMPAAEERGLATELRRILDRRLTASRLANSVVPRNPLLSARDTVLLAHPPATAGVKVSSARQLDVTYGIGDGAWKDGGATDGVCFRVFAAAADGERAKVYERCLRPVERAEDRGEQHVSIPLSLDRPRTLVFETDCGGNCSWDWAYWKDIDVIP